MLALCMAVSYNQDPAALPLSLPPLPLPLCHSPLCHSPPATHSSATLTSPQAVDLLTKALETSPSPAMWYLLGRIHQKANHHKDAIKSFQAALKSLKLSTFSEENTPSFRSDCFHSYGVSLFELREAAQALTLFNKAIKANRRNSQVPHVLQCTCASCIYVLTYSTYVFVYCTR